MATKQTPNSLIAPDGSYYVALTDGAGNLAPATGGTVSENLTQLNGTTIDTNSGTKSAGTQRVTIATDQPTLTNPLLVTNSAPYPSGAVPITASALSTTGVGVATLAGTAGKTTYISGFNVRANATAATFGTCAVAGPTTTLNFLQGAAATPLLAELSIVFNPPIPASAANTAITVTSIAAGTGGSCYTTAWGFQL